MLTLNELRDNLRQAAYDYVDAYTQELAIGHTTTTTTTTTTASLDLLLTDTLHEGTIEALMQSEIVGGNKTKGAEVLSVARATLRNRTERMEMLQNRKLKGLL